jgi:hypothetical protein
MQNLMLDPPVQLVATYRMDSGDRRYVDEQIRFTQKAVHETALLGRQCHWSWVDPAAEAIAVGDVLCISSTGDHEIAYLRRATTSALLDAGTVAGIALTAASPGGRVLVATAGHLPRTVTGLALLGYVAYVRVTPAGRLEQTVTPTGEMIVGRSEPNGRMTISLGSEASGGSLATVNDWKESARFCVTSALPAHTRTGNTIEANSNGAFPTVDGVTAQVGDRFVHAVGTDLENGIWAVVSLGSAGSKWSAARTSDADSSGDVTAGLRVGVTEGTNNKGVWQLITADPITLNTTPLTLQKDQGLPVGSAAGQTAIWNGSQWVAGALDLADADATTGTLALTKLPLGGANQVLWSNGSANSWTGAPSVTSLSASSHVALGATPAQSGPVRLTNGAFIYSRNAGDTGDLPVIGLNGADQVSIGTDFVQVTSTTVYLAVPTSVRFASSLSSPRITHDARTTDATPQNLTLTPQAPWASATGANRTSGSVIVDIAAPTNGGTTEAAFRVTRAGTLHVQAGPYNSPPTYTAIWLGPGISPTTTNFAFLGNGTSLTYLNVPSGGTAFVSVGGTSSTSLGVSAAAIDISGIGDVRWANTVTAPTIYQITRTTDAAPQNLTVTAQSAWASATGANRNGGNLDLKAGTKAAGGADGAVRLYSGATQVAGLGGASGDFIAFGADPADTGAIRLSQAMGVYGEPTAPGTDRTVLTWGVVAADATAVGNANDSTYLIGSTVIVDSASLRWLEGQASPLLFQAARTSDAAPQNLTISAQAPWASATLNNRIPGNLLLQVAAPTNGSTTEAGIGVMRAGALYARLGAGVSSSSQAMLHLAPSVVPSVTNYTLLGDGTSVVLNSPGALAFYTNGASTQMVLSTGLFQWYSTVSSPILSHAGLGSDIAPTSFKIRAQYPFASASGANRAPGFLTLDFGSPTNSGTTEAGVKITRSDSLHCQIGPYDSPPTYSAIWLGPGVAPVTSNFVVAAKADSTYLNVASGGTVYLTTAGTLSNGLQMTASVVQFNSPSSVQWKDGVSAPVLTQQTRTTDAAAQTLKIKAQSAYASAVTNVGGGTLELHGGDKVGEGGPGSVLIYAGNSTQLATFGSTKITFFNYLYFNETISGTVEAAQRTSDAATNPLYVTAGAAYSGSTGTNRNGGHLYLSGGARYTGGTDGSVIIRTGTTKMFEVTGSNTMAFFNVTPAAQPTVTGSRGGNAALASLLTGLASLGLVVDSSS